MLEYTLIRAKRKTISVKVERDGALTVRAPLKMKISDIDGFLLEKRDWIEKAQKRQREISDSAAALPPLTETEIKALKKAAREYIPQRTEYFSKIIGVTYGKISFRCQRGRWGSCSSRGNLSFNCLLMLLPPEVIDSVIVHELCHRRQMNHSAEFYREVYRVMPDYDKYRKILKAQGSVLLSRVEA